VATRYCPQCGGVNSPTATFCQYCGTALPPAPSAPLISAGAGGAPPPPPVWGAPPTGGPAYGGAPYGAAPYGTPPPRRPTRRIWLWILVGVVVFILVVGVIGYFLIPPAPAINVTEIVFQSADDPCGLANLAYYGFTANTSQVVWLALSVGGNSTSNGGSAPCTISTISSATTGFALTGADVPLSIPANSNETLQFNVTCPSASYNGVLTLSVT
jgi:Double zinc ribbon